MKAKRPPFAKPDAGLWPQPAAPTNQAKQTALRVKYTNAQSIITKRHLPRERDSTHPKAISTTQPETKMKIHKHFFKKDPGIQEQLFKSLHLVSKGRYSSRQILTQITVNMKTKATCIRTTHYK